MKKTIICGLGVLGMIVVSGSVAMGRTTTAAIGHAEAGSQANCFNYSYVNGAVTNICSYADFIAPLPYDNAGSKNMAFNAKATAAGAQCRLVATDRMGTTISASAMLAIPVTTSYIGQTTGWVSASMDGVLYADCITNNGTSIMGFYYTQ